MTDKSTGVSQKKVTGVSLARYCRSLTDGAAPDSDTLVPVDHFAHLRFSAPSVNKPAILITRWCLPITIHSSSIFDILPTRRKMQGAEHTTMGDSSFKD